MTYLEGLLLLIFGSWVLRCWYLGTWQMQAEVCRQRDRRKPYLHISATQQWLIKCSGSELHVTSTAQSSLRKVQQARPLWLAPQC